ncbi:MAG: alpha/beta fold hydrolase [Myxococcota bacterium]
MRCVWFLFLLAGPACGDDGRTSTPVDASVADRSLSDANVGDATADRSVNDADAATSDAMEDSSDRVAPMGRSPAERGTFSVTVQRDTVERNGRVIPVAAHVSDAMAARPLLVLLPGFQVSSDRYTALADYVASHGFTVVRADPPASLFDVSHVEMGEDTIAVLDWATANLTVSGEIAVAGHSLGGKVAVMAAGNDARIRAVFGIDPVNGGDPFLGYSARLPDIVPEVTSTLTVPVGYLGETTNGMGGGFQMPCAPTDQNYATFYEGSTAASWATEWTYAGADHFDFVPDVAGCGFVCAACTEGTADAAAVVAATSTLLTAFLRHHLEADAAMETFLRGGSVPTDVSVRSR